MIYLLKNGDSLIMDNDGVRRGKSITAGDVYVDGLRVGDIGSVVYTMIN